jgi:hypothetical protein
MYDRVGFIDFGGNALDEPLARGGHAHHGFISFDLNNFLIGLDLVSYIHGKPDDRCLGDRFSERILRTAQLVRGGESLVDHRTIGHDREVPPEPGDSGRVARQASLRERIGFQAIVEILVLTEDDRVVNLNRFEQHRVGVFNGGRSHHHHPGKMAIKRL